jgi:hypothetical protein
MVTTALWDKDFPMKAIHNSIAYGLPSAGETQDAEAVHNNTSVLFDGLDQPRKFYISLGRQGGELVG